MYDHGSYIDFSPLASLPSFTHPLPLALFLQHPPCHSFHIVYFPLSFLPSLGPPVSGPANLVCFLSLLQPLALFIPWRPSLSLTPCFPLNSPKISTSLFFRPSSKFSARRSTSVIIRKSVSEEQIVLTSSSFVRAYNVRRP